MFQPYRSARAQLAFVAAVVAAGLLLRPLFVPQPIAQAINQSTNPSIPDWATLPLLILVTAVACAVAVWVVRARQARTNGALVLADALVPIEQQTGSGRSYPSPDHRFVAVTGAHEVRMSIWLDELFLCDVRGNRWILHVPHPYDVSGIRWEAGNRLRFQVRRYPDGDLPVDVVLDADARTAEVRSGGQAETVSFQRLVSRLNRLQSSSVGSSSSGSGNA
jgi:hypothetical protein